MTRRQLAMLFGLGPLLLAGTRWARAQADDAREIMERVDARDDGDNMTATLEMTLIDRSGHERVRRIEQYRKDRGRDTLNMMFFQSPADVRGTGFLTYDYYGGERDDDQWLYLPELHKTKRIATSDKSSAFMGSDFSYADMTRRVLDEWTFSLLREDEVRGDKVWLIEALPVSDVVRERYGYTKSVVFVRQDIDMVVRGVNWLDDGRRIKYLDMKRLERIDGIWVGTEIDMKTTRDRETLHRTVMRLSDVKFGQDLDEDMFSTRTLERGL
jgi:hypothetical protein